MIPIVEKPENIEVKVSANVEDTTDIILLNFQIALNCMMEAKNLVMELHGESVMTDVLDDCIKKMNILINSNPKITEDGEYYGKNN